MAQGDPAKSGRAAELLRQINGTQDFYKVLGVPRDADEAAIKKAYRKIALQARAQGYARARRLFLLVCPRHLAQLPLTLVLSTAAAP